MRTGDIDLFITVRKRIEVARQTRIAEIERGYLSVDFIRVDYCKLSQGD
jgi:hypothetical protein